MVRYNDVLLGDFGTAIIAQSSRYQGTQDMVGTIAYMAPEQIQAHPRPASDQYALASSSTNGSAASIPFKAHLARSLRLCRMSNRYPTLFLKRKRLYECDVCLISSVTNVTAFPPGVLIRHCTLQEAILNGLHGE